MKTQGRSIRFKILSLLLVPLVCLVGLWGFLASLTLNDTLNYLRVQSVYASVGETLNFTAVSLQTERVLTVRYLNTGAATDLTALTKQRAVTDRYAATIKDDSLSKLRDAGQDSTVAAAQAALQQMDRLQSLRSAADSRELPAMTAYTTYTQLYDSVITSIVRLCGAGAPGLRLKLIVVDNLISANDLPARESTLIATLHGAKLGAAERAEFTSVATLRRAGFATVASQLPTAQQNILDNALNGPVGQSLSTLENQISATGQVKDPAAWNTAVGGFEAAVGALLTDYGDQLITDSRNEYRSSLVLLISASVIGLIALVGSALLVWRMGRRITGELSDLTTSALDIARQHLPRVLESLRHSEPEPDAELIAPVRTGSTTEITQVGQAFDTVQRSAVTAAVAEAELRRGVNEIVLNLAWRNQSLLHQQLAMLDAMERKAKEPEVLDDLFQLDHLTTRMRRHAENLIIMSGTSPGRTWRHPIAFADVLRASMSEVEDYTRVSVLATPGAALVGPAVSDVIHLVAEIVENATRFSPPGSEVRVRGELVSNGYAIEVEDRGIGMNYSQLASANHRLAEPPEFNPAESDQLGLFVVGKLAARHGIQVTLQNSPFGGISAIVLLPTAVITLEAETPAETVTELVEAGRDAAGRHRSMAAADFSGRHAVIAAAPPSRPAAEVAGDVKVGAPVRRATPGATRPQLPRRARLAALAPELRGKVPDLSSAALSHETETGGDGRDGPAGPDEGGRSPEEVRAMMSALSEGWRRGRAEGGLSFDETEETR